MQTEGLKNGDGSGNNDSVCHFLFCCVCFTSSRDSRVPPLLLQQHSSSLQQHTAVKKTLALGRHSPLSLSLSLILLSPPGSLCRNAMSGQCCPTAQRQKGGAKCQPSCKPTRSSGVHPASSPRMSPCLLNREARDHHRRGPEIAQLEIDLPPFITGMGQKKSWDLQVSE
jgi:hypothetical protein